MKFDVDEYGVFLRGLRTDAPDRRTFELQDRLDAAGFLVQRLRQDPELGEADIELFGPLTPEEMEHVVRIIESLTRKK